MKYLGKRFLKNWAEERFGKIKNPCEYNKYRGDEWIKNEEIDIFCIQGKKICVSQFKYDEEKEKTIETARKCYELENGEWKLVYKRMKK